MDGPTLTAALHWRGVNVRYLGTLLRELERVEEKGRLGHIQVATAVSNDRLLNPKRFPFELGIFF